MARPSDYTEELGIEIGARMLERGVGLKDVAQDDDMPSLRTMVRWISVHPEFGRVIDQARKDRAAIVLEETLPISDEPVKDNADASRQRNRISARQTFAERIDPHRFSPRIATGQAPELPPAQQQPFDELEAMRRLAFLFQRADVVLKDQAAEEKARQEASAVPVLALDPESLRRQRAFAAAFNTSTPPDEPPPAAADVIDGVEVLREFQESKQAERLQHRGSAAEHGLTERSRYPSSYTGGRPPHSARR